MNEGEEQDWEWLGCGARFVVTVAVIVTSHAYGQYPTQRSVNPSSGSTNGDGR
jgi:hypothetical protein